MIPGELSPDERSQYEAALQRVEPVVRAAEAAALYDEVRDAVCAEPVGSLARRLHTALGDLANVIIHQGADREAIAAEIEQLRPPYYTVGNWPHGYRKAVADAAQVARGEKP